MNLIACINEILLLGLDDWIQASEIASVTRTVGGAATHDEVRQLSLEIIRKVIKDGLMAVGDVTEKGFHVWELSADDALERIEREWTALGRNPSLGEICWLSNTEEGDRLARRMSHEQERILD
jgi:hypothetical protein